MLNQVVVFIRVRPDGVAMLQSPIGIAVHNGTHLESSICSVIFVREDRKSEIHLGKYSFHANWSDFVSWLDI